MAVLPEAVIKEWDNHAGPMVLTTVDGEGIPNSVYVTCVSRHSDDTLVIADNFLHKTQANVLARNPGVLLFITPDQNAFQIKGRFEYYTEGEFYEDMKKWNPADLPGRAAVVLRVEHVFSGADQLL